MTSVTAGRPACKAERSRLAAFRRDLRRAERVYVFAGFELGFVLSTKGEVRRLLKRMGAELVGRYVEWADELLVEPCPF